MHHARGHCRRRYAFNDRLLSSLDALRTPLDDVPEGQPDAHEGEAQGAVEDLHGLCAAHQGNPRIEKDIRRKYPWDRAPGDGFAVILRHN